ncbi:MAG: AMP-binding protein [Dehalococcoidia bacterium]|nr:AMP-binding protein [Dehalococcoidia bacterium]
MKRPELTTQYLAKGQWANITVAQALDRSVDAYPDHIAIVFGAERITYRELRRRADRLAGQFLRMGLKKGDIVTVQMPNWPEYVYIHYALARVGVVMLPTIPQYRRSEMSHILSFSRSVAYIAPVEFGGFDYVAMVEEMRADLPHLKNIFVVGEPAPPGAHSIREMLREDAPASPLPSFSADAEEVACMVVTGGTTGKSKGVPRTHNELLAHALTWARVMATTSESIFLVPAPATHVFGLVEGFYIPLTSGATAIWVDRFDTTEALRLIERERVTHALLVPALVVSLIHSPRFSDFDTSSLKTIITGGGPCAEEVIVQAKALLGCEVISQYGMSEGPLLTTALGDPPEVVAVTVGVPHCDGTEFKIVDEDRRPLPAGQRGELAFRGPSMFSGYFENPEETEAVMDEEGWFYSGDLSFEDEQGNIHIVGRKKDTIKRGGETVMPREIEELLYTHPKVLNAAVIGMPDLRLSERVCAYVVPQDNQTITLDEVVRFLNEKGLAKFKLPERLEVVQSLPITPPSKVQKNVLREDITRKLQAEGKVP